MARSKRLALFVAPLAIVFATLPMNQGQASAMQLTEDVNAVVAFSDGEDVFSIASNYIGTPYCHGGTSPRCFDCSGFVQYVYSKKGVDIARTSYEQYDQATMIPQDEAVVGDLVFFLSGGHVYHVGIYAGEGRVLHSPKPGRSVKIEYIWSSHVRYGRI